ncbi:MAG: TRAP transporter substrate-binding protein [Pontiellaceae bacterium]|nr:TRAP transporter substrate-binding protein [Pontiellaceae bacterium]MBN2785770.1 TRAP transporter substrate-binding protein [Pontiellaceae bacterium]
MSKQISFIVVGVLLSALLGTAVYSLKPKDTGGVSVLKLGHGLDTSHPVHLALEHMKTTLEEISGGMMSLDIYSGGVLGSEVECCEQLQHGILDMTKTSAVTMENFVPLMSVFGLPYVFNSEEQYWKVLNGDIGKRLLQAGDSKCLHGLCYYDAGSRNFYTKKKPILTPADLEGVKVRVMNSQTAIAMVKALGGSPTPISWGELYSALAQGTVDGAENNPPSFSSNKHYEVCKHFSFDGHTRVPDILLISNKVWDALTDEQKGWLEQAAVASAEFECRLWKEKTAEAIETAKKEGVTFYDVDVSLFAEKVRPMLEQVENPEVRELVRQISEVK